MLRWAVSEEPRRRLAPSRMTSSYACHPREQAARQASSWLRPGLVVEIPVDRVHSRTHFSRQRTRGSVILRNSFGQH